jgi:putative hydrolase of the HAD superfamily
MMGYAARKADVYDAEPAVVYGFPAMPSPRGLTLFIDADDTLWENNIYFEAIVADYLALTARHGCEPERARARLIEVERERVGRFGYGIANFQASLELAFRSLVEAETAVDTGVIAGSCASLRRRAGTHLGEVAATLRTLAGRHRLVLLTKGDPDDQAGKVARSGLRRHLHQVDVVPEKDVAAYRDVLRRHGADPQRSWMIGNSPKSDILPALGAGLGAVFVPHAATWALELTDLPPADTPRYQVLEHFRQLTSFF